ncbi:hypothetical protein AAG906_021677 [Vitis piasezkii]
MQRSINKKIGSCLLRFTPNLSPALLTRHHYSHFPLSPPHSLPIPTFLSILQPQPSTTQLLLCGTSLDSNRHYINRNFFTRAKEVKNIEINDQHSQRAVRTALWCNFLVFSLKFGVWLTTSSHVMLAEVVDSVADFANQALLSYGLSSSRRAPDAIHV